MVLEGTSPARLRGVLRERKFLGNGMWYWLEVDIAPGCWLLWFCVGGVDYDLEVELKRGGLLWKSEATGALCMGVGEWIVMGCDCQGSAGPAGARIMWASAWWNGLL
jgi:hypothetical protein